MSTPDPTQIVTAPVGWAKAKPVIFTLFVLILVLLTIRFREAIAGALAKIPVVGKWLTGIAHATTGVFILGFGLLSSQHPRVIERPPTPVVELANGGGYFHGHRVQALADLTHCDGVGVLAMPGARSGEGGAT